MFSPDSKFMEILGRITDLILLNILFLLTCLPIFTMGAAATALYAMCFRLMREEYKGIVKPYFQAFRDNFRQSTLIWLLLLLVVGPGLYYFYVLFSLDSLLRYLAFLFVLLALLSAMTASYAFPWISQFENTTAQALKNALILCLSHLPRSFAILLINAVPPIVWFFSPELFIQISFLWAALYFAAAAYMNSGILWPVFKPYRNA